MSTYFICAYCGTDIPAHIIEKRHYSPATMPPRVYCDKEHMNAHRQQIGEFKAMSTAGNAKRSRAVKESNRLNPRRRKK